MNKVCTSILNIQNTCMTLMSTSKCLQTYLYYHRLAVIWTFQMCLSIILQDQLHWSTSVIGEIILKCYTMSCD